MLKSEKKSLIRFLLIYLGSTLLLFSLASWLFYNAQKHDILEQQSNSLKFQSQHLSQTLRILHQTFSPTLSYPTHPFIESAIFDKDKNYIFGSKNAPKILDEKSFALDQERLYFIATLEPYYLGAKFLLLSKALDKEAIESLQYTILWFMLGAGLFFSLLGLFLGQLFVAPMRDSIKQMNHFIQDTTHELNTPISTILTNIEMLETFGKYKDSKELQRIEIASKTLSRIYDDLTYLNLNHNYHRALEWINISAFIHERIVYFSTMAQNKNIHIDLEIEEEIFLEIDKNDITRLIDNLISNAIKYNKNQGLLAIKLTQKALIVKDTGIGISKEDLKYILQRFRRANKSEGGFGIGLDIVAQVVASYDFILDIQSTLHQGTKVSITWSK